MGQGGGISSANVDTLSQNDVLPVMGIGAMAVPLQLIKGTATRSEPVDL